MKKNSVMVLIIIAVIVIIVLIGYLKTSTIDEQTIKCIASNSHLYIKEGCHYCTQQETILGNYTTLFNITECTQNIQECENVLGIPFSIPTWIINNQQYVGVKSLKELKSLTGC
jgi:uncharacterized membrane protein YkgB